MDRFRLLVWMSQLFLMTEAAVQKFVIEPEDQTALLNSRVILPCRVSNKVGNLQWTKDDFGLGIERNLSAWERYAMIGDQEEGEYYLEINPVMLEDDGRYQCQVSPASDYDEEIRSNFAILTVMIPPEVPKIVQGNYLVVYEYMPIELECISYGGRPAPAIDWFDAQENKLTQGTNCSVKVLPDGKRFLIKAILTISPRMEDQNSTFTCKSRYAAYEYYQSAQIKLDVRYPPHVNVSILSGPAANGVIPEGADVKLKCHAEANPPFVTYEWFLNDKIIEGNFTPELLLRNVTQKYQEARIKCKAYNEHGKSEGGEILRMSSPPQFRYEPQSALAHAGENITLRCDVAGSPPPDITWFLGDSSQILGYDANLTIQVNTSGRYKCKAHVVGYPDIEAEAIILIKGRPTIISPRIQYGVLGETIGVECTAHSVPAPIKFSWTHNYAEISFEEYIMMERDLAESVTSTLIVKKSQERHFGLYACYVLNSYGSDLIEINLLEQEGISVLALVCIGITVILVGVTIVVFISFYMWNKRLNAEAAYNGIDINLIRNRFKESHGDLVEL